MSDGRDEVIGAGPLGTRPFTSYEPSGEKARAPQPEKVRVLVAGVGNPWLRDLDFGPQFVRRAAALTWPPDVVVEDASYSAHRVLHLFQEVQPEKVVFVAGFPRGEEPGTVRRYVYDLAPVTDPEEVADRLGEAAGGVIDFDHTLIVLRHFKALPSDTIVIEVETGDTSFGTGFSDPVEASVETVLDLVRREVER